MSQKYILALDQGTTSSRAMVFDRDGRVQADPHNRVSEQIYPQPGWVEHDPEEILGPTLETAYGDALIRI